MVKSLLKEVYLLIKNSISRFLAIVLIVALGCGFYVGLRMSGPDMRAHEVDYLTSHAVYDLNLISTKGFDKDTIQGVRDVIPGDYQAVYTQDVDAQIAGRDESIRLTAVDRKLSSGKPLNVVEVLEGRLPEHPGECAISYRSLKGELHNIGDRITLDSQDDSQLGVAELKVVGLIRSPLYISHVYGFTQVGSGMLDTYAVVSQDAFKEDIPPALLYVKADELVGLSVLSDDYTEKLETLTSRLEMQAGDIAEVRNAGIRAKAEVKIHDAEDKLNAEEAKADKKLTDAHDTLKQGWADYRTGVADLAEGNKQVADGVAKLEEEKRSALSKLDAAEADLERKEEEIMGGLAQLPMSEDEARGALKQVETQISGLKAAIVPDQATLTALEGQRVNLAEMLATYTRLNAGLEQINAGKVELFQKREEANAQFKAAEEELSARKKQLEDAQETLESSRLKLEKGERELQAQEVDAQASIEVARKDIQKAKDEVADHANTEIYVLDILDNQSISSYWDDASRMDNISNVFPLMFYLVAGLVTLTTMTRTVAESRMAIGTHRALGFSRGYVAAQYLLYAFIASGVGLVIGVGSLFKALPYIIIKAYSFAYDIAPSWELMGLNDAFAYVGIFAGIVIVLAACMAALHSIMKETAASLMLPRAPQAGKKILMERLRLWKKLSFSQKVTFRNLFRYKKRLAMTIVGIAGCTALILTALALHDAIWGSLSKQYTSENPANVATLNIGLKDNVSQDDLAGLAALLNQDEMATHITPVHRTLVKVSKGDEVHALSLVVPQHPEDIADIENLSTVPDAAARMLEVGIVLPPKLAHILGVVPGDTIEVYSLNSVGQKSATSKQVVVSGISNRSIGIVGYTSAEVLENTLDTNYSTNALYGQCAQDEGTKDALRNMLKAEEKVQTIAFTSDDVAVFEKTLYSVDMVVGLLIVSAFILCAIVLYSLIDINICERYREIATVKVLGFTKSEIDLYIYKDTLYGVVFGIFCGLLLGAGLAVFVITSAESPLILFDHTIYLRAYLLSGLITLVFTLLIMGVLRYKVHRIQMAESLKSID